MLIHYEYMIHYRYRHHKSWNCDNPMNADEFKTWIEHERNTGNKFKIHPDGKTATVYINY